MSATITGTYENGQIKLDAMPAGVSCARVEVTFRPDPPRDGEPQARTAGRIMTSGMLAVPGNAVSAEEGLRGLQYDPTEWDRD